MSRLYNTFEFVGEIAIPKDFDKFLETKESKDWSSHRLNFGIKESKTNSVFLELFGGYKADGKGVVYSFGKGTENEKGKKLQIPWSDRLKPETLDMVADFKKIVVDFTEDEVVKDEIRKLKYEISTLEYKGNLSEDDIAKLKELKVKFNEVAKDRHEFITEYDAIVFLSNTLPDYEDKKFRITGLLEINEWKGKFYKKFKPELIEIVPQDTKNQLRATVDVFFGKDSVDESDFKTEKKIYIDGYVQSYDSKTKKDMFYPQQFVINAQKVNFENETMAKRFEFIKRKFEVRGKNIHHLQCEIAIVRGAERVEFTFDDLTPAQKEAVEFGLNKIEDFAPKGGMLGENIEEYRVVKPILKQYDKINDFREGAVETDLTEEDMIFVTTQDEKIEDIIKEEPKQEEKASELEVDLDDIFA